MKRSAIFLDSMRKGHLHSQTKVGSVSACNYAGETSKGLRDGCGLCVLFQACRYHWTELNRTEFICRQEVTLVSIVAGFFFFLLVVNQNVECDESLNAAHTQLASLGDVKPASLIHHNNSKQKKKRKKSPTYASNDVRERSSFRIQHRGSSEESARYAVCACPKTFAL